MSLRQTFVHCARFLIAASRRSLGRVSVPVWGVTLSGPLPVIGLVGLYLTNYLIGRRPILNRRSFIHDHVNVTWSYRALSRLSASYSQVKGKYLRVTQPSAMPIRRSAFDLHTLGTSLAFILSQDRTLH